MSRHRFLLSILLCLWMTGMAQAASVDAARVFTENREFDDAKRELQKVLDSAAEDREKAEALDLLGTIAVDQKEFDAASAAWSRLLNDYPELAEELGARTKLFLVDTLLGRDSEAVTGAPIDPPAAPASQREVEIAEQPTSVSTPQPRETPVRSEIVESAQAESAPTAVAVPKRSDLVLIAAEGRPYDAAQATADRIMKYLSKRGVKVESATEGLPLMMNAAQAWARLIQAVETRDASSFLFVQSEYEGRQRIRITAHTPDGVELWTEKVTGGTGWTGRKASPSGINEDLLDRALKKLESRPGGPGLPVSGGAGSG